MKAIQSLGTFIQRWKTVQFILAGLGIASLAAALIMGLSDHPPGLISFFAGMIFLAAALVWQWRSPRRFWVLGSGSLAAFIVLGIFHNLLFALSLGAAEYKLISSTAEILGVVFFVTAILLAPPLFFTALVGGLIASWKGFPNLVYKNRSYRRFYQQADLSESLLIDLVNLARVSASSANKQALKYFLSWKPETNQLIFSTLGWAGYLKDWPGPEEGERPSGYILILGDQELGSEFRYDAGIAAQTMLLGAVERGLGGCLLASIRRKELCEALKISDQYQILLAVALGYPKERVVLDEVGRDGKIEYWRDDQGIHHVPKRPLKELIVNP